MYYFHTDALGTPQAMTNASEQIVWQASYSPFGLATITQEDIVNNLRFPGQYFDAETNITYNGNRFYDEYVGRYIQADPTGMAAGTNLYAYVESNPLTHADPKGLNRNDPFYGLPRPFWNWFHRSGDIEAEKDENGLVPPDVARQYYQEWLNRGQPKPGCN